jgi:hypothetical protein
MCYTCGCQRPYDDMGSKENLTEEDFKKAGETDAIGRLGTLEAKKNALKLLQMQADKQELEKPKEQY